MTFLKRTLSTVLFLIVCASVCSASNAAPDLNIGYRQMYNLDFAGAHRTFTEWEQSYPNDPLGPVSQAAAYLFAEFNRLKVLQFDLFTENQSFEKRPKLIADQSVKTSFESELAKSDQIANRALAANPNDSRAL